ncbi:MAG TPA: hypothetical protein VE422_45765 [Terriglobia bacterium]|nr:hypothetical protein [Terriglobia bacterium]
MPDPAVHGPTPEAPAVAIARLGIVAHGQVSKWVDVQFNPTSLQLQLSNPPNNPGTERTQYVPKSSAKLTMDLQFDTTDNGVDVTETTRKLQAFILPAAANPRDRQTPPLVMFEWGKFKFKGIAENYKETIDFFSAGGIPLRAAVNLTLSRQELVFEKGEPARADVGANADQEIGTPTQGGAPKSEEFKPHFKPRAMSVFDLLAAVASSQAVRALAEANGQESLRFGNGSPLTVREDISLKPAAAFSDIARRTGIGGDAGIGPDALMGIMSTGAELNAGFPLEQGPGVSPLARLSAAEGAFRALRTSAASGASTARLNTSRLLPQARSAPLSTDRGASFSVGGKAALEGPAGLRADVGAGGGFRGKLTFED